MDNGDLPDDDTLRDTLRDIARRLTATHGMKWTMARLAHETGISRARIYRIYPGGRADVMAAVLGRRVTKADLTAMTSILWGPAWRPNSVRDWAAVHAMLTTGPTAITVDEDECRLCGGDVTDHIDGIREGAYGEDVDVLLCLTDELDDVLYGLETGDPPLEHRELAVLRAVRDAYRRHLGHPTDD